MSLILEALRRSEAQRRSGRLPGLHDPSPAPVRQSAGPRLGLGIGLGIGLGLAVGIGLLLLFDRYTDSAPSPSPADDRAATLPASMSPAAALLREFDAPTQVLVAPAAAPMAMPATTRAPTPMPAPATPASPVTSADPAPAANPEAAPIASTVNTDIAEAIPTEDALDLNQLDTASRALLPPLRVSMHVYDPDPMRRFVLIDGRRLREGEALTAELRLVAIERDGLRFDWRGRALRLPR